MQDTAFINRAANIGKVVPHILSFGNPVLMDTQYWTHIAGIYRAKGGEQYLTIGNFNDDAHTDTLLNYPFNLFYGAACYYLDDVSVIPLDSMVLRADAGPDTSVARGDSVWVGTRLCGLDSALWRDSLGAVVARNVPGFMARPTVSTYYVLEQTVCGQYSRDTVRVSVHAPLPLRLLAFEARPSGREALLSWRFAPPVAQGARVVVERSQDQGPFLPMSTEPAAERSSYTDPALSTGRYDYRLSITAPDGRTGRSRIATVEIPPTETGPALHVYPNPSRGTVSLRFPGPGPWLAELIDPSGRTRFSKTYPGTAAKQDFPALHGIYRLVLTNTATGAVHSRTLVLQ